MPLFIRSQKITGDICWPFFKNKCLGASWKVLKIGIPGPLYSFSNFRNIIQHRAYQ